MTPWEEAVAFHGMALNTGRPVAERLELALEALKRYEAEVLRLQEREQYEAFKDNPFMERGGLME